MAKTKATNEETPIEGLGGITRSELLDAVAAKGLNATVKLKLEEIAAKLKAPTR